MIRMRLVPAKAFPGIVMEPVTGVPQVLPVPVKLPMGITVSKRPSWSTSKKAVKKLRYAPSAFPVTDMGYVAPATTLATMLVKSSTAGEPPTVPGLVLLMSAKVTLQIGSMLEIVGSQMLQIAVAVMPTSIGVLAAVPLPAQVTCRRYQVVAVCEVE